VITLRKIYGQGFAPEFADSEKLAEVLHKMDEPSLSKLIRDHESEVSKSSYVKHKIEPPHNQSGAFFRAYEHLVAEQAVRAILRFSRKIELRREQASRWLLHLDMDMSRAPLIQTWHNAAQAIPAMRISELMAAQAET
jgi:hypothetical protein